MPANIFSKLCSPYRIIEELCDICGDHLFLRHVQDAESPSDMLNLPGKTLVNQQDPEKQLVSNDNDYCTESDSDSDWDVRSNDSTRIISHRSKAVQCRKHNDLDDSSFSSESVIISLQQRFKSHQKQFIERTPDRIRFRIRSVKKIQRNARRFLARTKLENMTLHVNIAGSRPSEERFPSEPTPVSKRLRIGYVRRRQRKQKLKKREASAIVIEK
jgi:hypothetical protein